MSIQDGRWRDKYYKDHDVARKYGNDSSQPNRSPFEIDKGRIIHSAAFRRLQGKTQVLGVGERDFYRTRLTHSLEVAQLGRGMCAELMPPSEFRPNPDLVETICLAHDIGHAAFGHFGEDVLHRLMLRDGGFGANPQNLRIVTFLEAKFTPGGLDLTRATLDGLVKYPVFFNLKKHREKSKFTYKADHELFDWIKQRVKHKTRTPIEGQIADWADQVAYSVNDIEDTLRAGLLSFVDVQSHAEDISRVAKDTAGENDDPSITDVAAIRKRACDLQKRLVAPRDLGERKRNLKKWTSDTIKELMHDDVKIVPNGRGESSMRYQYDLKKSKAAVSTSAVLKSIAQLLVFEHPRVKTLQYKGGYILRRLFRAFSHDTALLPLDFQELLKQHPRMKERLIADFISGMTDNYAYSYFNRLFQPGEGSFDEYV